MPQQIKNLLTQVAMYLAIFSICLALWAAVGACIGFGWTVGKALAGIM